MKPENLQVSLGLLASADLQAGEQVLSHLGDQAELHRGWWSSSNNDYGNLLALENVVVNELLPDGTFPEYPAVVVRSDVFLAQVEHWRRQALSQSYRSLSVLVSAGLTLY